MENPRLVTGCLLSLLGVLTAAVLGFSIYLRDLDLLVGWLGGLVVVLVVCVVMQLCLATVFYPIFWLMSRCLGTKDGKKHRSDETNTSSAVRWAP